MSGSRADREWLEAQVAEYSDLQPQYAQFVELLDLILGDATLRYAPLAIVQTRTKVIASFAEKCLRKRDKYRFPVHQLTDLAGARVIARTTSEVDALSQFIERTFEIDWENSVDASKRLHPSEFGYRSVHYIVSLKPEFDVGHDIPDDLRGFQCARCDLFHRYQAEVQVRTTVQHAWADFAHDLSYKGAFELPDTWKREIAVIAAELENVDRAFARVEEGLSTYAAGYGSYLSEDQVHDEIANLETVLSFDPGNARLASRVAKLAMTVGDWKRAISVLTPYIEPKKIHATDAHVLRDMGLALCRRYEHRPESREYQRGQRYLRTATTLAPEDSEALDALASTWRGLDDDQARELYRRAVELDPTDYVALENFIDYEIERTGSIDALHLFRPASSAAISRCRAHAGVGINAPRADYALAKFHLLQGDPYAALGTYARALRLSTAAFAVRGGLGALERIGSIADQLEGHEWAYRLLLIGAASRFGDPSSAPSVRRLQTQGVGSIQGPVVILVGGAAPSVEARLQGYGALLDKAFSSFNGTIISGGTSQGVSGLAAGIGVAAGGRIQTVGYLPNGPLPSDAARDVRYDEIRTTDGDGFTPLEPLQNWIDILASGIDPADVKVLGVNGGRIASVEFRIALALGATVGIIEQSGREAARLLGDEHWSGSERLIPLPPDAQTLRSFLASGSRLDPDVEEALAREVHAVYQSDVAAARQSGDPALRDWEQLPESLRKSSREQANQIVEKLREIGCSVHRVGDREIVQMSFTSDEVETMAEMEHGRWTAERLREGWRWGPERDLDRKTSPYLVSWSGLPGDIKEYDRVFVRRIPRILAAGGLEIRR